MCFTFLKSQGINVGSSIVDDENIEFCKNILSEYGVKVLALRCAGFNNVDMKHAFGKLHVLRVPAYSPYAVAEHTMALLLTLNRKIHKAFIRTKDFNFNIAEYFHFCNRLLKTVWDY